MARITFLLATLLALAAPAMAQDAAPAPAPTPTPQKPSTAGPGVQPRSAAFTIPVLDRQRHVQVYLPPGYATSSKRYPVLYMHDGQNLFDDRTSFMGEWGVDESLDRLAREKGLELIVVGIDNGGDRRINELKPWPDKQFGAGEADAYLAFIVDVVKPWVDANYRTKQGRDDTGIMGSSLGGIASWYAAFKYPQVFGRIGVFSPSYWITPDGYEMARVEKLPAGTRMFQLVGGREGDPKGGDRTVINADHMEGVLRHAQPGLELRAVMRPEGEHNEKFWRAEFPAAVEYLFGRASAKK